MTDEIPEVRVEVSREKLASLCAMARDAALDLQAMAWAEYPGDRPYEVRKRTNEIEWAERLIALADKLAPVDAIEDRRA